MWLICTPYKNCNNRLCSVPSDIHYSIWVNLFIFTINSNTQCFLGINNCETRKLEPLTCLARMLVKWHRKTRKFSFDCFISIFNVLHIAVFINNTWVSKMRRGQRKLINQIRFTSTEVRATKYLWRSSELEISIQNKRFNRIHDELHSYLRLNMETRLNLSPVI